MKNVKARSLNGSHIGKTVTIEEPNRRAHGQLRTVIHGAGPEVNLQVDGDSLRVPKDFEVVFDD